MNDLTVFASAGLPSVKSVAQSLRAIKTDVDGAGSVILKMDKTGHWFFGADQTEVEDGSLWAVNPYSFVHGFIAWGEGEVLAEKLVPVSQPLPELEPAPAASKRGWETQVGFALKCMSGEDKGLEVRYAVTSLGGRKAVQALAVALAEHIETDETTPVALVTLGKDHYTHKSYGRVYTPVFKVVEWIGMNGEAPETAAAAEEPAPAGRRRRA